MAKTKEKLLTEAMAEKNPPGFWLKLVLRCTPLVLAIVLVLLSIWFLRQNLYLHNQFFRLKKIAAQPTSNYSELRLKTILSEMGVEENSGTLPALPVGAIRERLQKEPLIATSTIRRIFPDTLQISIRERVPVAVLQSRHQGCEFTIDQEAFILPGEVRGLSANLPLVITIPNDHALRIGDQTDNRWLRGVLQFLDLLAARPEGTLYLPRLIRINQPGNQLHVQLQAKGIFKQGATLVLPLDNLAPALDRLRDVVRQRSQTGQSISYIDVTLERNIPVRP
ncbi:MAG: FtsQ-type POTRA domain-containing protein [Oligosphaeraceae bacterium]|nr:FtsQ-type POTRA domain-containing protein [Oligosphaeraceae bacterium]